MASIIDNRSKTMLESLKNSLKQAESVDILTAFFYFSGFNALAEELKDKKIRILVGNTIDPDAIADLCNAVKDSPEETLLKVKLWVTQYRHTFTLLTRISFKIMDVTLVLSEDNA